MQENCSDHRNIEGFQLHLWCSFLEPRDGDESISAHQKSTCSLWFPRVPCSETGATWLVLANGLWVEVISWLRRLRASVPPLSTCPLQGWPRWPRTPGDIGTRWRGAAGSTSQSHDLQINWCCMKPPRFQGLFVTAAQPIPILTNLVR